MKKVLSLIMTLVMMFGVVSVVATETHAAEHTHCICGGKAVGVGDHKSCSSVTYTELTADLAAAKLPAGNYYLAADLTLETELIPAKDAVVNICLNGYKLKSAATKQALKVNQTGVTLSICDCKGTGVVEGNATIAGACLYQAVASTVNLFGGTLSYKASVGSAQGATYVLNNADSVFNMYGGVITGGATAGKTTDGVTSNDQAGNAFIKRGVMNMYGGSITKGIAGSNGGNVYVWEEGTLNLYNGTVTGGTLTADADENGAGKSDIYVNGTLNLYNVQESMYLKYGDKGVSKADFSKMDSSLSGVPTGEDGLKKNFLLTKTSGGTTGGSTSSTPVTGDAANPVIVALVMVVAAACAVYFVPKKRRA